MFVEYGVKRYRAPIGAVCTLNFSGRDARAKEMLFNYFYAPESNSGAGIIQW